MRTDQNWFRVARDWGAFAVPSVVWGGTSCVVSPIARSRRLSAWLMNHWARSACRWTGIHVTLEHGERLDPTRQKVMVANHNSLLDIPIIGSQLTHDYRWVAKRQMFNAPFIGWHLAITGHVAVQRGGVESKDALRARFARVLAEGADLLFFAEGTRSEDGRLQAFKLGAFLAAVEAGVPVQPLVVRGSADLMQKGKLHLDPSHPHDCSVTVLPLIEGPAGEAPAGSDPRARAEALRDAAHAAFARELQD